MDTTLGELASIFDKDHFALVVAEQRCFSAERESTRVTVVGVVTRIDLTQFIARGPVASPPAEAAQE